MTFLRYIFIKGFKNQRVTYCHTIRSVSSSRGFGADKHSRQFQRQSRRVRSQEVDTQNDYRRGPIFIISYIQTLWEHEVQTRNPPLEASEVDAETIHNAFLPQSSTLLSGNQRRNILTRQHRIHYGLVVEFPWIQESRILRKWWWWGG